MATTKYEKKLISGHVFNFQTIIFLKAAYKLELVII